MLKANKVAPEPECGFSLMNMKFKITFPNPKDFDF